MCERSLIVTERPFRLTAVSWTLSFAHEGMAWAEAVAEALTPNYKDEADLLVRFVE